MRNRTNKKKIKAKPLRKQGKAQLQSISAKAGEERQIEKQAQNWHFKN